jgi:hypothetical protein
VGDLKNYLKSPNISNMPLTQKVLAPAAAGNQPLSDPKLVISLALDAVKKGELTMPQAISGITGVYQSASMQNQAARGLNTFGIIPPAAGKTYNVKLDRFGNPIDITKPEQLQRYFMKQMRESNLKELEGLLPKRPGTPF